MNSARLLLDLISLPRRVDGAQGWDAVIHRTALRSLMLALQYREPTVVQHSRRVAALTVGVAQYLGWEGQKLQILEAACLLHDIGKVGVPDMILHKPARLTPDELEVIDLLHHIAGDILQACGCDPEVIRIVNESQYHYNGAGQDFRSIGSGVHQGARILAVVDAYDSLTNPQSFRDGHSHQAAIEMLQRGAGSRYDGNVISALNRWFSQNGIPEELKTINQDQYSLRSEETIEAGSLSHVFSYLYLLESLYNGFHICGPDQGVIVWNPALEALTGRSWQQVRHQPVHQFLKFRSRGGEALTDAQRPIQTALTTRHMVTTELQLFAETGEWLPVEVQTIPLIDQAGQLKGFAEIFRDLTGDRETGEYRDLRLMASRDALTHVANRGELKKHLDRQFQEWRDRGRTNPFSVIFLDVDHFKKVNDTHGHAAGDEVLISVARLLQHETFSGEMVARYGGEEFVILCSDTSLEQAFSKADRLRSALAGAQVVKGDEFRVTASFGCAEIEGTDTAESVIQRADKALYMAKHQGRNRTCRLTALELKNADVNLVRPPAANENRFVYERKLRACLTSDMIQYKMRAIVDNLKVKLVRVTQDRVEFQFGRRGLIPVWGATAARQPATAVLNFNFDERAIIRRGASKLVEITVTVRPLGWARDPEAFRSRAVDVLTQIREYLVAESGD